MTDHKDTTASRPQLLRMRFGSELNAPRPGDTLPRKVAFKTEPAANADAQPSDPQRTPF